FLVDVSGSMDRREGLPLVKSTLKLLVDQLRDQDRVSLVVYAGESRVVLTPCSTTASNPAWWMRACSRG
ncbi:VWA domain-containing protein, partial [Klebsiella pneumoniae]|uniref:VWA domain-containing protein n=1 Tax=Klebsiella pneumoniae TaxID=573 RepID=UPI0027318A23